MNNRNEEKQLRRKNIKIKFNKIIIVLLFIVFALSAIYAVDTSTSRIMKSKDNKRAIGLDISEDYNVQVELVGEKYAFNTEGTVNSFNRTLLNIKNFFIDIYNAIITD